MPTYSPSGNLYIGTVPFDNSYKHVMWFDSVQEQQNYLLTAVRPAVGDGTYKYIRRDNAIQVPINAEQLNNINYLAYKNTNYGDKWFYCFVNNIEYVNANTTRLYIETDIFQTWLFDWNHNEAAFVAREHVNNDAIGANLNQEPPMWLDYCTITQSNHINDMRYAVIQTTTYPYTYDDQGRSRSVNCSIDGAVIGDVPFGTAFIIFDLDDNDQRARFETTMGQYTSAGCADAITSIFILPSWSVGSPSTQIQPLVVNNGGVGVTVPNMYMLNIPTKQGIPVVVNNIARLNTHTSGYVPLNNKLLTYPYTYLEVGDYSGRTTDYKFEYSDDTSQIQLGIQEPPYPEGIGYAIPYNYDGHNGRASEFSFTFNFGIDAGWTGSEYAQWRMVNKDIMTRELELTHRMQDYNVITGVIGSIGAAMGATVLPEEPNKGAQAAGLFGAGAQIGNYALQYQKSEMDYQNADLRMSRIPNHALGNTSGNAKAAVSMNGVYWRQVGLRVQSARIIDDYFSMFGYAIDQLKVPLYHSRANWNFVKTVNANFSGTAPQYAMNAINKMFDSGITLWHHGAVGDYLYGDPLSSRPLNPIV